MLNGQTSDNHIDKKQLYDECISVNEFIKNYRNLIEGESVLQTGTFDSRKKSGNMTITISNGLFDDDIWVIQQTLTKGYIYLDFTQLNNLKYNELIDFHKNLLKCYISNLLIKSIYYLSDDNQNSEKRVSESTRMKLNKLCDFINISNFFNLEFLNTNDGNNITYYLNSKYNSTNSKYFTVLIIKEYLDFILSNNIILPKYISHENLFEYNSLVSMLKDDYHSAFDTRRKLPSSNNILSFDYFLNKFFKDDSVTNIEKMLFYPVLIWWKFTNIIPMRISECCVKLQRNCLSNVDKDYYININRVKRTEDQYKITNNLPLLSKIKITKEIYDLISEYIDETDKYGQSQTLFSYRAYVHYYKVLSIQNTSYRHSIMKAKYKLNKDYFTATQFSNLLNVFYSLIINERYKGNEVITQRIRPGDTRHFAFTSLLLQGIPLVEIAMLGGHSNLKSLYHYTYDADIYIDSQVFININKNLSNSNVNRQTLYNIVYNMPKKCPIKQNESIETIFNSIKLGYCTADDNYACDCHDCYNCSKWYCEPSKGNYLTLCNVVKLELNRQYDTLHSDINFLFKLFKNSAMLFSENNVGDITITHNSYKEMEIAIKKLQSSTDEVVRIKSDLLTSCLNYDEELTELEIIEKLQYLSDTFVEDADYLSLV